MNELDDILFDDYLNNSLSNEDKLAFEKKLIDNTAFRLAFDNHILAIKAIQHDARSNVLNLIQQVYLDNKIDIDHSNYKPKYKGNGGSGFSFANLFFATLALGILATITCIVLSLTNVLPENNPINKKVNSAIHYYDSIVKLEERVDTIWYYEESEIVQKGDTIISFPDKEIRIIQNKVDTIYR